MDKYWVYRPLLDLIAKAEGTAAPRGREYNETLAYGAYTGGPVNLVSMSLQTVDDLQSKMLRHPANRWNSSAAGRYQIVRTTRRAIEQRLGITRDELFDKDMQDRMACYLLGFRGIDEYLKGRLSRYDLLDNLAKEWASFPNRNNQGHYDGQRTGTSVAEVLGVLAEVQERFESRHTRPKKKEEEQHWFVRLLMAVFGLKK